MKQIKLGVTAKSGEPVLLDLDRLVESRMLVQANSGGGKSWALRRILEQTHGHIQHLILDLEGEFHTLREKFDYVLVAKTGGEVSADPRLAAMLAKRLLEMGVSAIIDLSELKEHERMRYVKLFLEALVEAPRDLWHPVLVVVDEAHKFCPEKDQAESRAAVIDLMTRGRKRGLCGILATQRLSKLGKDAAAEANVKLIGRAAQDVDMKRAADELGFTSQEDRVKLRQLPPGRFFAFGPGLSSEVCPVDIGEVQTSHPKIGHRAAPIPPPREKLRKVLDQLADLPKEAEAEHKAAADLRAEVTSLKRQLAARPKGETVTKTVTVEVACPFVPEEVKTALEAASNAIAAAGRAVLSVKKTKIAPAPILLPRRAIPPAATPPPRAVATAIPEDGPLTGPEQRVLDAIAWFNVIGVDRPEQAAVASKAGYTVTSSAYERPRGSLNRREFIALNGDGAIVLTEAGKAVARYPDAPPTEEQLHAEILSNLPGPEQRLLKPLLAARGEVVSQEEIAEAAGYSVTSSAFERPRGRLRTYGLIDFASGGLKARDILFLEGARA